MTNLDSFICKSCNGPMIEQKLWINEIIGFITYKICLECESIIINIDGLNQRDLELVNRGISKFEDECR